MVSKEQVETKLRARFHPELLFVDDVSSGCGAKFDLVLVSAEFEGVPLIDRQRAVNECLAEEMTSIHALSMKTWTPAQFTKKRGDGTLPPEVSSRLPLPSDEAAAGPG